MTHRRIISSKKSSKDSDTGSHYQYGIVPVDRRPLFRRINNSFHSNIVYNTSDTASIQQEEANI